MSWGEEWDDFLLLTSCGFCPVCRRDLAHVRDAGGCEDTEHREMALEKMTKNPCVQTQFRHSPPPREHGGEQRVYLWDTQG